MLETAWESRWVPDHYGGVAQLGEHLPCKQGVKSSNLSISIGTGNRACTLKTAYRKRKPKKNLKQEIDIREAVKNSQKKEEPKTGDVTLYIRAKGTRKKSPKPEPVKQERAQGGCLGTESR